MIKIFNAIQPVKNNELNECYSNKTQENANKEGGKQNARTIKVLEQR
jgi:hypothetical protein